MESREAFIAIKRKVRFQQADKEKESHYTILGNTLVRISNHCTYLYVWDNYLEKHPNCKTMNIVSIVFEDNGDTYSPECLYLKRQRQTPIVVTEYVYKSKLITKPAMLQIISDLQKMDYTNRYDDNTGLATKKVRYSVNPDFNNLEYSVNGKLLPGGNHGMDAPIEETKVNNIAKKPITEAQLKQFIKECIRESLK